LPSGTQVLALSTFESHRATGTKDAHPLRSDESEDLDLDRCVIALVVGQRDGSVRDLHPIRIRLDRQPVDGPPLPPPTLRPDPDRFGQGARRALRYRELVRQGVDRLRAREWEVLSGNHLP
jgi:hypothetical protein